MALIPSILSFNINRIINSNYNSFPENAYQVASKWADAINTYAKIITPPSISFEKARLSMLNILLGSTESNMFTTLFPIALMTYQLELGLGMQPAFTATPPIIPVNIQSIISLGMTKATAELISQTFALKIDTSFRTGLAINNSSGVTIPWA